MALKLDDESTQNNYDDNQPAWRTNLEGAGSEDPYAAPDATDDDSPENHSDRKTASPQELEASEASAGGNVDSPKGKDAEAAEKEQVGAGYNANDSTVASKVSSVVTNGLSGKKGLFIGGGIGGAIIAFIIFSILSILPFKVTSILENLQNRFTATGTSALRAETQNMVSGYLKITAKQCKGTTVEKACTPTYLGSSPVSNLYKVWHDNKLETTLAEKYGIEIQYNTASNQYYLKSPGLGAEDVRLTDEVNNDADTTNIFAKANKADVRQAIDDAIEKETKLKQVALRFKFGGLMKQKYGIKRCVTHIGCTVSDSITDTLQKPKRAAEVYLAERVLMPRSQILGTVVSCLLDTNCDPAHKTAEPCTSGQDCELNGAPESKVDTETRTKLDSLVTKFAGDDAYQIYQDVSENGLQSYLVKQLAITLGGDAAGNAVDKALPVVGWVNLASQIVQGAGSAAAKVKYLRYVTNAGAMVGTYMMYRTYADQMKSGHVDPQEVGSFTDALGPGDHRDDPKQPAQVGGMAGAEDSPLYTNLLGNGSSPATSALSNLLPSSKVYAASQTAPYLSSCKSPPDAGALICPEEQLGGGNDLVNTISDAVNSIPLLGDVASVINGTVGTALSTVGNAVSSALHGLPIIGGFLSGIEGAIADAAQPLLNMIAEKLIPNPFGNDMSGGRTFNMIAGGADVAGNDYAHHSLGGQQLTPAQASAITNEQMAFEAQQFQQKSLFARMFDKTDSHSLVSNVAMAMPLDAKSSVASGFSSLLSDPFSKLTRSFGALFGNNHVFAQATATNDPFNVTQYGYPDGAIPNDPASYWDANCQDGSQTQKWNEAAAASINTQTGQAENNVTNPCLLISAAVASAGGYYSDSVLSPDDLSASGSGGNQTTGNKSIFVIGDSLTDGMVNEGDLAQQLTTAGWNPTKLEYTSGISINSSLAKIDADSDSVRSSDTIVVELGTNDARGASQDDIAQKIEVMIPKIKAISPSAQIYWVNLHSTVFDVSAANAAISALSAPLGYKVIDWNQESLANASKYSFDSDLGVHQTTGQGYHNMANFVVSSLPKP